jgi:hypothetical protein
MSTPVASRHTRVGEALGERRLRHLRASLRRACAERAPIRARRRQHAVEPHGVPLDREADGAGGARGARERARNDRKSGLLRRLGRPAPPGAIGGRRSRRRFVKRRPDRGHVGGWRRRRSGGARKRVALTVLEGDVRDHARLGLGHRVHRAGLHFLHGKLAQVVARRSRRHRRRRGRCRLLRGLRCRGGLRQRRRKRHRRRLLGRPKRHRADGDDSRGQHRAESKQGPLWHARNGTSLRRRRQRRTPQPLSADMRREMKPSIADASIQRSTATIPVVGSIHVELAPAPLAKMLSGEALAERPRWVLSHHK